VTGETLMRVDAQVAAPQTESQERVRFEGVAITPGVFQAEGELQIRITEAHLDAITERMRHAQIRDLHEETIEATVGQVTEAEVVDEAVTFVGEIARDPHATIVREFPDSIRFSLGFRFSAEELDVEDGVADLPEDFVIVHLAIAGRGQDPDSRLERLLNQAEHQRQADQETTMENEELIAELRRQKDEALEARNQAQEELSRLEGRHEETAAKLEDQIDELAAELDEPRGARGRRAPVERGQAARRRRGAQAGAQGRARPGSDRAACRAARARVRGAG